MIIDPEYHYEAVNVEAQQANPASLLWWMKRLIALRKRHQAFGRGTLEFLPPDNRKVLAFIRRYEDETHPRRGQPVALHASRRSSISAHSPGAMPVEMFGRVEFPAIGERAVLPDARPARLLLVLAWIATRDGWKRAVDDRLRHCRGLRRSAVRLPELRAPEGWDALLRERGRTRLADALPPWIAARALVPRQGPRHHRCDDPRT